MLRTARLSEVRHSGPLLPSISLVLGLADAAQQQIFSRDCKKLKTAKVVETLVVQDLARTEVQKVDFLLFTNSDK